MGARDRGWRDAASFLAGLPDDERMLFSRYAALDVPESPEEMAGRLRAFAAENPTVTPSGLLAATAARAGRPGFARRIGEAALELAEDREERQLAHVCLAQVHFQNRREQEHLASFVEHCRAAVDLGHAGTFCYERLAVLYEYRGEIEAAAAVCRRAVEVLEGAGDTRSAARFRKRLDRLGREGGG